MKVSNSDWVTLGLTVGCAGVNAYLAPVSFTIGFAVGATCGAGMGFFRRANLLLVNANEKAVIAGKKALPSSINERAAQVKAQFDSSMDQVNPVVKSVAQFILSCTAWVPTLKFAADRISNFDEQRSEILKNLDPIPGWKGNLLSLVTTAANLNAAAYPLFSQLGLLSGLTPGYAVGIYLANRVTA